MMSARCASLRADKAVSLGASLRPRDSDYPFEVTYVGVAPLSAFAMAIEKALQEEGISQAEVARRMQVSASVVSRITDPVYLGRTSRTLRAVADVLGRDIKIHLER